jgi:hypothetical protein
MKLQELIKISDPKEVKRRFEIYRGSTKATIEPSPRADKKYLVRVDGKRAIHFGSHMEDYTHHLNEDRRRNYLNRSAGIKGDWRNDKWSPNNLARNLLW